MHTFFIYSSSNGCIGSFPILAVLNNAMMNMGCRYLFELVFSFSFKSGRGKATVIKEIRAQESEVGEV